MRIISALSIASAASALLLPPPDGPYPVSMSVHSLTDETRIDPYAPRGSHTKRRVLMSLFLPIESKDVKSTKKVVPYMTPVVASDYDFLAQSVGLPNDTFASYEVETSQINSQGQTCRGSRASTKKPTEIPLVIFSPGSGQSRLLYGVMARSLASEGYAVATLDHPYDASVVEFPDGTIVKAANISDEDTKALEQILQVRAADVSFVIDQLKHSSVFKKIMVQHHATINFDHIVMYGHSLGGTTAAAAMLNDPRIKGGMDMDGKLLNPVLTKGLRRPFVLLGRPGHQSEDKTWAEFFPKLRGSRFEMAVADASHGSFTDFPVLIDSLNLPQPMKEQVAMFLGTASGKTMDRVIKGVMKAFCDFVAGKSPVPAVLKKNQKVIPELTVLSSDIQK